MQTVNFACPHCGNLMAVGLDLLGRNVRCPTCKQVVQAPPPAPATAAAPPPSSVEAPESIFGEVHDEDVFGSRQMKPEMPADLTSSSGATGFAPYPPPAQVPPPAPQPGNPFEVPT